MEHRLSLVDVEEFIGYLSDKNEITGEEFDELSDDEDVSRISQQITSFV
jgi:hypothetical protein